MLFKSFSYLLFGCIKSERFHAKVTTLQTAVDEAKSAANEAKNKAQEALDKANSTEGGVSEADLTALKKELEKQIEKLASLEAVETKIQKGFPLC